MWLLVASLFLLAVLLLASSLFTLLLTRVPVVRTPLEHLGEIQAAADMREGQTVVDAGCADARTLLHLCAGRGVRGRGYELNGPVWLAARLRVLGAGRGREVKVHWRDFLRSDWEDVDVVYCYLMPGSMGPVGEKCLREMRCGSRLLSYLWPVPGWIPTQCVYLGRRADPLYVYEIGTREPGLKT